MCDDTHCSSEIAVVVRFVDKVSGAVYGAYFDNNGWVGDSEWVAVLGDGQGVVGIDAVG